MIQETDTDNLNEFLDFFKDNNNNISKYFNIAHTNIRSLKANLNLLESQIHPILQNLDVLVLSEIWIKDNQKALYNIKSFRPIFNTREHNQSGGIAMYVKDNIKFKIIESQNLFKTAEIIQIYIKQTDTNILAIYRINKTNINTFNNELEDFLQKNIGQKFIIIGDINIDNLKNNTQVNNYKDIYAKFGFLSTITKHTRQQNNIKSAIDHIFINKIDKININTINYEASLTDHNIIAIKIKNKQKNPVKENKYYYKKHIDYQTYEQHIIQYKHILINDNDNMQNISDKINDMIYYCTLKSLIINKIEKQNKKYKNEWMNQEIFDLINYKNNIYKLIKQFPNYIPYKTQHKNIIRQIKSKIKIQKKNYYSQIYKDNKNNSKNKWKFINKILGNTHKKKQSTFPDNNSIINTLNNMNTHFVDIIKKLDIQNYNDIQNWNENNKIPYFNNSIYFYDVDLKELTEIINKINTTAAIGIDQITISHIKPILKHKPNLLIKFINNSIKQHYYPHSARISKVIPIYKTGNKNDPNNYRPIAINSIISKIFESLINNRIQDFFDKHNIIAQNQFGFKKNTSTSDALLYITNIITQSINENKNTIAIFLDISKAFDSINHKILIKKLYKYGIRGYILEWIESYLDNRSQITYHKSYSSKILKIKQGIPQGSILSSLLFNVFINDYCLMESEALKVNYADDSALVYINLNKINNLNNINKDLKKIHYWFTINKMKINQNKTKFINFTTKKQPSLQIKFHNFNCNINTCSCPQIQQTIIFKYLGIIFQENLKWNQHIDNICTKLRIIQTNIYYLKNLLPQQILIDIFFAFAYTKIIYALEIYGATFSTTINKINKYINKIIKLIDPNNTSLNIIFKLKEIRYIYTIKISKLIYKNKIILQNKSTNRQLRNNDLKNVPFCKKEIARKQTSYIAPKIYNYLNKKMEFNQPTLFKFKKELNNFLNTQPDIQNIFK